MKFICTQQNLAQGLSLAEKIIGRNFSLPILQNILVSCEKKTGRIKLSSTDLEMGIEVVIPAKIEEEGSITVPAKLFGGVFGYMFSCLVCVCYMARLIPLLFHCLPKAFPQDNPHP